MRTPHPTTEVSTQYLILEGRLDANLQGLQADHEEAFAASGPLLKANLQPSQRQRVAAVEQFRQRARDVIRNGSGEQTITAARYAQTKLIGGLRTSWAAGNEALDRLLQRCIDGFFERMWLHLGTALAASTHLRPPGPSVRLRLAPPPAGTDCTAVQSPAFSGGTAQGSS